MTTSLSSTRRRMLAVSAGLLLAPAVMRGARAQGTKDITIAVSSNSFSTVALRFAERRGFFAKHGLKARIVTMDSANGSFAALIGGSAQVASAGPGEALAAMARGQEILAVTNIYRGLSSFIVVAKSVAEKSGLNPDSPLVDRLKALDGITFASPSATAIFGLSIELSVKSVGAQMKMTYIGQGGMAAALESGAVQGMVAGTPYWVPPVLHGAGLVWIKPVSGELPYEFTPTSSGTLMLTKQYARANPDLIVALKAVSADIADFVTHDRDGAIKDLAAIYPTLDAQTISLGFSNEWQNWARPVVTVEDVRHDIDYLKTAGQGFAGMDNIDPKSLVTL